MSQTGTTAAARKKGRPVQWIALLLVAAGLAVALGAGWQWLGKVRHVAHQQEALDSALDQRWAATPGTAPGAAASGVTGLPAAVRPAPAGRVAVGSPAAGTPIARLHLPTLGERLVIVEGSGDAQLMKGPGRMVETPPLGAPGNTAVAGHRYPGVFWNLDRLATGDPVVVETAEAWLVYRTVRTVIVEPADESVLASPPAGRPTMLTMITCEPKLSTAQRLVKQAVLVRTDPRTATAPRELAASTRRT
jgi:sortase A